MTNPLLFIVLFAIVAIAIAAIAAYIDQKRTEAMQAVAQELGLSFYPRGEMVLPSVCDFQLFCKGHTRRAKNLMQGELRYTGIQIPVAIFDYRYTTGHGKNRHTHSQTVFYLHSELLGLPEFLLRPEHLFDKIGSLIGFRDIDFAECPQFSRTYLLKGRDEPAIFRIFKPDVIRFYENRRVCTEASGSRLILYRPSTYVQPSAIRGLVTEGFNLFDLLRQNH
jgi:hypothetical protein